LNQCKLDKKEVPDSSYEAYCEKQGLHAPFFTDSLENYRVQECFNEVINLALRRVLKDTAPDEPSTLASSVIKLDSPKASKSDDQRTLGYKVAALFKPKPTLPDPIRTADLADLATLIKSYQRYYHILVRYYHTLF